MSVIEMGKGVILKGDKNLKYIRVCEGKSEFNRKFSFNTDSLRGKKYGTAFQIKPDLNLQIIDPLLVDDHGGDVMQETNTNDTEMKDNRNIDDIADSKNQKLSKEDIMSLQDEGASGKEIIQELIENSSTFNERTDFSKAKYLQKKKQKYVPQFLALKPCARLLSQMYYFKNPDKILHVRPDTLAQILTYSNVQSDSNVLVFETCQGLITGAVLERLGANGKLLQLYKASFPGRQIMEQFNYTQSCIDDLVCSLQIDRMDVLQEMFKEGMSDNDILEEMLGKNYNSENVAKKDEQKEEGSLVTDGNENKNKKEKIMNGRQKRKLDKYTKKLEENSVSFMSRAHRAKESLSALTLLRSNNISSLIIVSKYHPKNILLVLLKTLPPGCPFVVYYQYKEPLMECYVCLKELNMATDIELTQAWFRDIQVLPNRTHPVNMMSGSGGYILRGVKVNSSRVNELDR